MSWVLHRPRPQPLRTSWRADEIVVTRGGECVDRLRANEIERVTLVHAGDGESPGDVRTVLFELADRAVLLDAASGIAGRVLFERQAYWAQRRCIYWVNDRQLIWQAVEGAQRWRFLRPRVPPHRVLTPATTAALVARARPTGPHTWDERKQHRIERRRPFPGRPIGATPAHGGAPG
jgi:hypothetical protein